MFFTFQFLYIENCILQRGKERRIVRIGERISSIIQTKAKIVLCFSSSHVRLETWNFISKRLFKRSRFKDLFPLFVLFQTNIRLVALELRGVDFALLCNFWHGLDYFKAFHKDICFQVEAKICIATVEGQWNHSFANRENFIDHRDINIFINSSSLALFCPTDSGEENIKVL